jgi:hypothetical protein
MAPAEKRGREILIGIVGGIVGGLIVAVGNFVVVEGYMNIEVLEVAVELLKEKPDGEGSDSNLHRNARAMLCSRLPAQGCPTVQ